MPVEMLYMIDVSGSMAGTSIGQAREALLQALDRLRPSDRFGILQFSNDYREFRSAPLPATPENLEAARDYVHRPEIAVGQKDNVAQIFAALRHDLGGARLYTVAIGSAPNLF